MRAFARGEFHILVSTTVVEVGVDVPNASVMVVEHAERFGLSQLHQLRGRVGRGRAPVVLRAAVSGAAHRRRARAAEGARPTRPTASCIAERDLELRGPGDFFGTRQSGMPTLRVGDLLRDQPADGGGAARGGRRARRRARRPTSLAAFVRASWAAAVRPGRSRVAGGAMRIIAGHAQGPPARQSRLARPAADVRQAARDAVQRARPVGRRRARARRLCRHRRGRHRGAEPRRGARHVRRQRPAGRRPHRRPTSRTAGSTSAMLLSAWILRASRPGSHGEARLRHHLPRSAVRRRTRWRRRSPRPPDWRRRRRAWSSSTRGGTSRRRRRGSCG